MAKAGENHPVSVMQARSNLLGLKRVAISRSAFFSVGLTYPLRWISLLANERMADKFKPTSVDGNRLKQLNLELGQLARKHKACRLNSRLFSGLGAVVLVISLLGLIHLLPSGVSDWAQNPNSPVYAIAIQDQSAHMLRAVVVAVGLVAGLALLYTARLRCSERRSLWKREGDLRKEMRRIRDELYVVDQLHSVHEAHPKRHPVPTAPLNPDEARGEYVGLYNPPASHRDHSPGPV